MESPDIVSQLTNLVIRPHREIYGIDRLGDKQILVKSKLTNDYIRVLRRDITLSNTRKIQLSIFQPENNHHSTPNIVVFLHSNSGSRLQGLDYVKCILHQGMMAVVFDYCGSGISEGQYVTMGINQSSDLGEVYQYLHQQYRADKICLWGRSMGAVTAILYSCKHPEHINAAILDSPFCSFNDLIRDLVRSKTGLPDFFFTPIISRIQSCIINKTHQNLFQIDLRKNIHRMKQVKCLFITSNNDQLVPSHHTKSLYDLHHGFKDVVYLEGNHNQPRSLQLKQTCAQFLAKSIIQNPSTKSSLKHYKQKYNRQSQNNTLCTPKLPNQLQSHINTCNSDKFILNNHTQHKTHQIYRLSSKPTRESFIHNNNVESYNQHQHPIKSPQNKIDLNSKVSLSIFKKSMMFPSERYQFTTPYRQKNTKIEHRHFLSTSKAFLKSVQSQKIMKNYQPIKQHINLCGQVPNESQSQCYPTQLPKKQLKTFIKQHH